MGDMTFLKLKLNYHKKYYLLELAPEEGIKN
jgi:hypothetical protein